MPKKEVIYAKDMRGFSPQTWLQLQQSSNESKLWYGQSYSR